MFLRRGSSPGFLMTHSVSSLLRIAHFVSPCSVTDNSMFAISVTSLTLAEANCSILESDAILYPPLWSLLTQLLYFLIQVHPKNTRTSTIPYPEGVLQIPYPEGRK